MQQMESKRPPTPSPRRVRCYTVTPRQRGSPYGSRRLLVVCKLLCAPIHKLILITSQQVEPFADGCLGELTLLPLRRTDLKQHNILSKHIPDH